MGPGPWSVSFGVSAPQCLAGHSVLRLWLAVCTKIARAHTHIFARTHKSRPSPFGPPIILIRYIAHVITVPNILRPPGLFTLRKLRANIAQPWEQSQSTPTPRSQRLVKDYSGNNCSNMLAIYILDMELNIFGV